MKGSLCVAIILLGLAFALRAQDLEIRTGVGTYQRALPQTVEEGQTVSSGLADTLNSVIAAWEEENAQASVQVEAIIHGNQAALKSEKQAQASLQGLPGGLLAKTLALGVYASKEPSLAFGPSLTWNLWNLALATGHAGVVLNSQPSIEASLALEWWLF